MPKRTWTDEETEKLVRLRKKGVPYKEIAKILNKTVSACQTQRHNIKYGVDMLSRKIKEGEI